MHLLPLEGTVVTEQYMKFEYFSNHFTNDLPDRVHECCISTQFIQRGVWLCYEKKSFLEVFHCYSLCHCVVKGHMSPMEAFLPVSWGRHWKMISAWNDLVPNTLLLFSTGSRTTFIHTGVELVDKKLSWKTMFYLYFVCLDGKTNEQTSPSSCCTEHRQAKAMIT